MYKCSNCWYETKNKSFKCDKCGEFGTLEQYQEAKSTKMSTTTRSSDVKYSSVTLPSKFDYNQDIKQFERYQFKSSSLNEIFGWGLVKGSVNYLSAEPWTWKSTLLWQLWQLLENESLKILYYSGEENESQISSRLKRLYQDNVSLIDNINLYYWESLEELMWLIDRDSPDIVIVDSLQKIRSVDKEGDTGSIWQQSYCIDRLTFFLKSKQITGFVIWHVNKDWDLAGSKKIEHIVDAVYVMEWQESRMDSIRLIKSLKCRFGEVWTVVVLKMTERWFEILDQENAFKAFIQESWDWPWSVFTPVIEWNQLFLLEIQSLLVDSMYSNPKKTWIGISYQKLDILIAVLMNITKFPIDSKDVFVNVIGFMSKDSIIDLWVLASMISYILKKNVKNYLFIWQVWLMWEIRTLPRQDEIIRRLLKLWYKREQIVTRENAKNLLELISKYFDINTGS